LGLGDGTFQPDLTDPRHGGTNPLGIVAGDFNRDGIPDLAAVSYTGGDVFVYQGRGDGTFGNRVRYGVGSTPAQIVAADFNGDGRLDVAVTDLFSPDHDVLIFLGNGDGTFQEPPLQVPVGLGPLGILADDFNHDGKTDLAVTNFGVAGKKAVQGAGGAG